MARHPSQNLTTKHQHAFHSPTNSGEEPEIKADEARRLIRQSTPVVVAYRHDDRPSRHQLHRLWKETGPPTPAMVKSQLPGRMIR